ncbi:MAG: UvrB/UvrC motif-containing protein [Candidatus Paceibacterota bacterium]|jgi:excinuclease ABC subunit C
MKSQDLKKYKLPDLPGVYFFQRDREILYVGKATSLKDRVKSYFAGDLGETRGPKITQMLTLANKIKWQETDSVLEALLLETELIKKHQPVYNTREKDDKSYWFVIITDEDFPRVLPIRGRELEGRALGSRTSSEPEVRLQKTKPEFVFGPFPYGGELKEALKIIRKIFPYRDKCLPCVASAKQGVPCRLRGESSSEPEVSPRNRCRPCFNRQIGLCPGVCTGEISKINYRKIVRNIELLFRGKKKEIVKKLEQEMKSLAKKREFEKASEVRDQIFALNHIRDVSLLKKRSSIGRDRPISPYSIRLEAYDIAHLAGTNTTGAMVVWQNGELDKHEYKKFKLRGVKAGSPDDLANLHEILERRFNHPEWPQPDIIVVDGNQVQVEVAKKVIKSQVRKMTSGSPEVAFRTPQVIAVTKDDKHRASRLIGDPAIIRDYRQAIIEVNAEAHRFALAYHRKLRRRLV